MSEKIQLEQSELPPACPYCHTELTEMNWHKVKGGPSLVGYMAIISCPHCRRMLGVMGV